MSNRPLISIIVPVYNMEKYLERCINSILEQTYGNIELILVDDGSVDSSFAVCEKYQIRDKRVIAIHKENGGQGSARNVGLDIAKGDYIGFVDSDDWIDNDMYSNLLAAIQKNNADIVECGEIYRYEEGVSEEKQRVKTETVFLPIQAMEILLSKKVVITNSPCDKLYNKKIFDGLRFLENRMLEDTAIMYRLIDKSSKIVVIPNMGYNVFCDPNSVSRRQYNPRRMDTIITYKEMTDFFAENAKYSHLVLSATHYWAGAIKHNAGEAYCVRFAERKETLSIVKKHARELLKSKRKLAFKDIISLYIICLNIKLFGFFYRLKKQKG